MQCSMTIWIEIHISIYHFKMSFTIIIENFTFQTNLFFNQSFANPWIVNWIKYNSMINFQKSSETKKTKILFSSKNQKLFFIYTSHLLLCICEPKKINLFQLILFSSRGSFFDLFYFCCCLIYHWTHDPSQHLICIWNQKFYFLFFLFCQIYLLNRKLHEKKLVVNI